MEQVKRRNSGNSGTHSSIQQKPDNRGWFDEKWKTAIDEKNKAYKKNGLINQLDKKTKIWETPENSP